jgi:pyruvate/2-oxoglutarate/acetoin dehydrogenase E1 component
MNHSQMKKFPPHKTNFHSGRKVYVPLVVRITLGNVPKKKKTKLQPPKASMDHMHRGLAMVLAWAKHLPTHSLESAISHKVGKMFSLDNQATYYQKQTKCPEKEINQTMSRDSEVLSISITVNSITRFVNYSPVVMMLVLVTFLWLDWP